MTEQILVPPDSFTVQQPFGPYLADITINDEVYNALIKMTDKIIKDEKTKSHGSSLAGVIEKELRIYRSDMVEAGVSDFMESCINSYVKHCIMNQIEKEHPANKDFENRVKVLTEINSAWIVSQRGNEYNPAHSHNGCEVSGVLYLKIPNVKNRRNIKGKEGKEDLDGDIQFIYSSASKREGEILDEGMKTIRPKEKWMVLFPSYLLHTVYPFIGDDERRCISFNANYRILQKMGVGTDGKPIYNFVAGNNQGIINETFYGEEKP